MTYIPRVEGRTVFGESPADYDRFRPPYPRFVYETLVSRCGLQAGASTFEIGPGSGLATRELLHLGASPYVAVESDPRFAEFLSRTHPEIQVVSSPFEDADLPVATFDLGVAATSMHWLEEASALLRVARLLKPGGWWACWWNVFGDWNREDPFHEATNDIMRPLGDSPSSGERGTPYALDEGARIAALEATGAFEDIACEAVPWTLTLDTAGVRGLYSTYSQVARLPAEERERVLDQLSEVSDRQFGGSVDRNMTTALYTARTRA